MKAGARANMRLDPRIISHLSQSEQLRPRQEMLARVQRENDHQASILWILWATLPETGLDVRA